MQAEKKFFDVFSRYKPSDEKASLLRRGHSARFRYTKDPMRVEVDLSFDSHEDAELIYEIEDECRALYSAESFKILPHFPPESFEIGNFGEIACEAAMCGAVTNGFFTNAEYLDDGVTISILIPFDSTGVGFVKGADTENILENILRSRYGVSRRIVVTEGAGADARRIEWEKKREQLLAAAEEESRERFIREREERAKAREAEARAADPQYDFESRSGISTATGIAEAVGESSYKMGATTYDFSSSTAIYGESFDICEPTPLADAPCREP